MAKVSRPLQHNIEFSLYCTIGGTKKKVLQVLGVFHRGENCYLCFDEEIRDQEDVWGAKKDAF